MPEQTRHESLAAALAAFQMEMPTVHKGKTAKVPTKAGGSYSYDYADLADVSAAAMPLLASHGLAFTCLPCRIDGTHDYELTARLVHTAGENVEGSLPLRGSTPQEWGSSLTYMRRYLLGCLTGIVTDADDDGALASKSKPQTAPRQAPPRTPPPPVTPAEVAGPMTAKTRGRMFALFGERGIDDRDEQIRGIAHVIGRPIASRSELTEAEARSVIDRLTATTGASA